MNKNIKGIGVDERFSKFDEKKETMWKELFKELGIEIDNKEKENIHNKENKECAA